MRQTAGIASTQILGMSALLCGCQMLNLATPARALFAFWLALELVPA